MRHTETPRPIYRGKAPIHDQLLAEREAAAARIEEVRAARIAAHGPDAFGDRRRRWHRAQLAAFVLRFAGWFAAGALLGTLLVWLLADPTRPSWPLALGAILAAGAVLLFVVWSDRADR